MTTSVFHLKRLFVHIAEDIIRAKQANKPEKEIAPLLKKLKLLDEAINALMP